MNSLVHFKFLLTVTISLLLGVLSSQAYEGVRIKDVARVQGNRDNQLIGYGLVVGLDNQGDTDPVLTRQTVANLVRQFGITIDQANIKAKNSAIVMVTALVRAGATNGSKMNVNVMSIADAKSLQGGALLQTRLLGADKRMYALAQGNLSIGGFQAGGSGVGSASFVKNHPTAGSIPDGAIVEREIPTDYYNNGVLEVSLFQPDFTSSVRMAGAINEQVAPIAHATSPFSVKVFVPEEFRSDERQAEFNARIENVFFKPDVAARIVINEKTGTIVTNSKIKIDAGAVTHGNLTVSIVNTAIVSQPNPFTGPSIGNFSQSGGGGGGAAVGSNNALVPLSIGNNIFYNDNNGNQIQVPSGQTPPPGFTVVMVPAQPTTAVANGAAPGNVTINSPQATVLGQETTHVEEEKKNMITFKDLASVEDVAAALNAMGVTPRDMMAIFTEMKNAGILHAELVTE